MPRDGDRPKPQSEPIHPVHWQPQAPQRNDLLRLLCLYRHDPASLPLEQSEEIRRQLKRLRRELRCDESLTFREVRPVDHDTVCVVFEGKPDGLCSIGYRASLLVDQNWNLSGGILFDGLRATPIRLN